MDNYESSSSESGSSEETYVTEQSIETKETKGSDEETEGLPQLLPSADSVLSTVTPSTDSLLPPKRSAKFQSIVEYFDLNAEQPTRGSELEKKQQERHEKDHIAEIDRNDRKRPFAMEDTSTRKISVTRVKKNAKERRFHKNHQAHQDKVRDGVRLGWARLNSAKRQFQAKRNKTLLGRTEGAVHGATSFKDESMDMSAQQQPEGCHDGEHR
ncbi:hypothetical protein PsorP6_006785 [Peronosclerospora sorghi]|uniref:Uncharacterized protein n=1 Tax=Peronosclerospora sorghi TaxID=230839 RepID=A0ACC0W582_9STRA|nr:hypothetical protein PsorP6_006785 [Peronosclerospora sorghi]